jgi:hypothetical protein
MNVAQTHDLIVHSFEKAINYEKWGDRLEAGQEYAR